MAENSKIEWTDHTFNPWIGCTAISAACDHCYAEALVERWGGDFSTRRRTSESNWKLPVSWNKKARDSGVRRRVFCASLADVFDNKVPAAWRDDLWKLIVATPWLDWLLLTKRPQNIAGMLPQSWGVGWPNVWLGTTVENQTEARRRIPHLLNTPATIRFLSCEPLLAPIDLTGCLDQIDWLICGGESGRGARYMEHAWAADLIAACSAADTAFFMKQMTKKAPIPAHLLVRQFPSSDV